MTIKDVDSDDKKVGKAKDDAVARIRKLTAADVLKIADSQPELLFSKGDEATVKKEYRLLSVKFHPDKNGNSEESNKVFAHINVLHRTAEERIKNGKWETPNRVTFTDLANKQYNLRYIKKTPFDLGEMYISNDNVTYAVEKQHKDMFKNALNMIGRLQYPNETVEKNLKACMPQIQKTFETSDRLVMVLKKNKDDICLADAVGHVGNKVDPKHAAWMMSRLHYIATFLQGQHLTHNAINTETIFISPEHHTCMLLGGWWYAAKEGDKLNALPGYSYNLASPTLKKDKRADSALDGTLIRATIREVLGDVTGMTLRLDKNIPKPFTDWVNAPSSGNALADYQAWNGKVVDAAFGKRTFVPMPLTAKEVYKL